MVLSNAIGGIKLQVKAADFRRAEFLLGQLPDTVRVNYRRAHSQETAFATAETREELDADATEENAKDLAVDRLFRVAVFGLIFCPIQFYGLWLLLTLNTVDGVISRNRWWKVWVAALLNVPVLLVGVLVLFRLARF